jgi:hypothetical protein
MFVVTCDACSVEETVSKFIFELSIFGHLCPKCEDYVSCDDCGYIHCECE